MRKKARAGSPRQKQSAPEQQRAQEIIEGLRPVCICKGIRQRVFLQHIRDGSATVEELQRATGAGSGSCTGKRCTPKIADLLGRYVRK